MLEGSLEVVQGTAPSPFPRPRASAPICCCWDSGLSVRSREDVSSPPRGSCRPHTLSPLLLRHLLPCCPAARLRVPSLGVSLLLFLGAMSQGPSGKGVLSFNFWRKGVSLSVSLHAFTCSAAAPYTAFCRKTPAAEPAQLSPSKYSSLANQLPRTRCTLERSRPWRRCRSNFREQSGTPGQQRR